MKHVLHIVGPTATGKTDLALHLAKIFSGDLISADSRQVYQGMAIGTGQDIPPQAGWGLSTLKLFGQKIGYYQSGKTKIWGYDLVNPNQAWSIAHFYALVGRLVPYLHRRNRLPIIVGGSGLYHQTVTQPPATITVPPNPALRRKLAKLSPSKLQKCLAKISSAKLTSLNPSDRANPRRLIRAIEIANYQSDHPAKSFNKLNSANYHSLWLGLDLPNSQIASLIKTRVTNRLKSGFIAEFDRLYKSGLLNPGSQAATATGYSSWLSFRQNQIDQSTAIKKWVLAELQYAKRQKTWFKSKPDVRWFKAFDPAAVSQIVEVVKTWYSK